MNAVMASAYGSIGKLCCITAGRKREGKGVKWGVYLEKT